MKRLLIFVLVTALMSGVLNTSALSEMGSVGEEVTRVQTVLKEKGYYTGTPDGIYGILTRDAVSAFQKDNGLSADGIVGSKTLSALGITDDYDNTYGNFSSADFELLARIISAEARGEEYTGQVAVGAVVLNRIEHPSFPDTLAEVVYQNGAFSCINDGQFYELISDSAYSAAHDAINGLDPSGGAVYYYNPQKSTNKWIFSRPVITVIGSHRFCG